MPLTTQDLFFRLAKHAGTEELKRLQAFTNDELHYSTLYRFKSGKTKQLSARVIKAFQKYTPSLKLSDLSHLLAKYQKKISLQDIHSMLVDLHCDKSQAEICRLYNLSLCTLHTMEDGSRLRVHQKTMDIMIGALPDLRDHDLSHLIILEKQSSSCRQTAYFLSLIRRPASWQESQNQNYL